MTEQHITKDEGRLSKVTSYLGKTRNDWLSIRLFKRLIRLTLIVALLTIVYWLFFASDRYVSKPTSSSVKRTLSARLRLT